MKVFETPLAGALVLENNRYGAYLLQMLKERVF